MDACKVAKKYHVSIEIDHEGTNGGDVEGLKNFAVGYRKKCKLGGDHLLTLDVSGTPGASALPWAADAVRELVPMTGAPYDPAPKDQPNAFDYVNLMSIGACNDAECLISFWEQWQSFAFINYRRSTLTFSAGKICDDKDRGAMINKVAQWAQTQDVYGLRAWSVSSLAGAEWNAECDAIGAPGLQRMCSSMGLCAKPHHVASKLLLVRKISGQDADGKWSLHPHDSLHGH